MRLGLLTSLIGFAALAFSGFPGLAQLGVFSMAGLAAAAATTRFVLPILAPDGAPGRGLRRRLGVAMGRAATALAAQPGSPSSLAAAAAVVALAVHAVAVARQPGGAEPDRRRRAASATPRCAPTSARPTPARWSPSRRRTRRPRSQGAEAVGARLDVLVRRGELAGYDSPARLLPSPRNAGGAARRAARRRPTLRLRLAAATAGGPLPAERLAPFVADVEAARAAPLLTDAALAGTPLGAALDRCWSRAATDGRGARSSTCRRPPAGRSTRPGCARRWPTSPARTSSPSESSSTALRPLSARGHVAGRARRARGGRSCSPGVCATPRRLLRVCVPIAAAATIVIAGLTAAGIALGILHLVGMLLTVAIGSNYALFFDHLRENGQADEDTLASLLLANLTTVASFGLLATSAIPVLQSIGRVVAPGALLGLVLSAAFIAPVRHGRIPTR